jgi:hypothetical protein
MKTTNIMPTNIFRIALGTALILLIPVLGKWPWTRSDFVVMGTMLFVTGLMLDLVMRKMGKYRVAAAVVIVVLFLWLWVELAVGLFTNWGS